MATTGKLVWDQDGSRYYHTGVDRGVLFPMGVSGVYDSGVAWSGLTDITESPSGADETALYADNTKYGSMRAPEKFGMTIKAYMYPPEFEACDGSASLVKGVSAGQQSRKTFGLCYRTEIGNDVSSAAGYEIHLVYGITASPSQKDHATVNDSPNALEFSWDATTNPVTINDSFKPTSSITISSLTADPTKLAALEAILYGVDAPTQTASRLPLPAEIITLMTPAG